jgi:hypothetical protein
MSIVIATLFLNTANENCSLVDQTTILNKGYFRPLDFKNTLDFKHKTTESAIYCIRMYDEREKSKPTK